MYVYVCSQKDRRQIALPVITPIRQWPHGTHVYLYIYIIYIINILSKQDTSR